MYSNENSLIQSDYIRRSFAITFYELMSNTGLISMNLLYFNIDLQINLPPFYSMKL